MTEVKPLNTKITLSDGLTIGGVTHKEIELQDIRGRDILDATEAAERIVVAKDGKAVCVVSDVRLGMEILRRRIKKFGTIEMPLSLDELLNLTERDITALQDAVDDLDKARAVATMGRN